MYTVYPDFDKYVRQLAKTKQKFVCEMGTAIFVQVNPTYDYNNVGG